MAIRIKFDQSHNAIQPTLVLSTKSGDRIGVLHATDINFSDQLNSSSELQFKVHKIVDGIECPIWNEIIDFKLVWCPEWDIWFEITVEIDEEDDTVKNVSGVTIGESELSQINLYDININTEIDIERDDYKPTVLYNPEDRNASLLNRILEKAPHYTIGNVDYTIKNIQRTFTFDDISIYDALQEISTEIDCLFVIDSGSNNDGTIARKINAYDLCSVCLNCGERGRFTDTCPECGSRNIQNGYGNDTNIFVSIDNLADKITYKSNTSSVKNCFRLIAGDDLMTAVIRSCNPNGSDYIWNFNNESKQDMSSSLRSKLNAYDDLYRYYKNTHSVSFSSGTYGNMRTNYNTLVNKYRTYNSNIKALDSSLIGQSALINAHYNALDFRHLLEDTLMPNVSMSSTTASQQAYYLNTSSMSPVSVMSLTSLSLSSATNAVLSMAKVIIDARYQVKVDSKSLSGSTWTGSFIVTNLSDPTDTAKSNTFSVTINDNYENFLNQKLKKALNKETDDNIDISSLFNKNLSDFKTELKKYCLNSLNILNNVCVTCLNLLIEQGISDDDTWAESSTNLYNTIYVPYYNKQSAISAEIRLREEEICIIAGSYDEDGVIIQDGIQTVIEKEIQSVQNALNFENYIGTELMKELATYRRESTYENTNYISDGLTNAEMINNAKEFLKTAENELIKSSTLQHSITSSFKNLLVMKEFEPIVDHFEVGNWIRISVDGSIYKLRLVSYTIDFNNLSDLQVEFSDVQKMVDGISDIESILSKASSMSTSYGYVSRQASKGKDAREWLEDWVGVGLSLTKLKIIDNAANQNLQIDERGMLCREYLPMFDSYDSKQVRLINKGLYFTDDNWRTARAGIGNFIYYDPSDGTEKEGYGVIADTIVSDIILSKNVGVYNKTGSIKLDQNGLTLISNSDNNATIFRIQRYVEGGENEDIIWFDNDGNANFDGHLSAACLTSGYISPDRVEPGSITGTKIEDGAITTDKIAANSINADKLQTNAVTSDKIEANAITTDKIAANAVTATMITTGTIKDKNNKNYWNLDNGDFSLSASTTIGDSNVNLYNTLNSKAKIYYGVYRVGSPYSYLPSSSTSSLSSGDMRYDGSSKTYIYSSGSWLEFKDAKEGDYLVDTYTGSTYKWNGSRWILVTDYKTSISNLDSSLNQEAIFNRLTNNGTIQGIYMRNGSLYINASYIQSGTLKLGGASNTNGQLEIRNASDSIIGKWNKDGIDITAGSINIGNGNFEVSAEGVMSIQSAIIKNNFSAASGGYNATGLILGRGQISALYNGSQIFAISMPYFSSYPVTKPSGTNINQLDPPVEEIPTFEIGTEIKYPTNYDRSSVTFMTSSSHNLKIGVDKHSVLTMISYSRNYSNNKKYIDLCIDCRKLFVQDINNNTYETAASGEFLAADGQTIKVTNGIITGISGYKTTGYTGSGWTWGSDHGAILMSFKNGVLTGVTYGSELGWD